MIDTKEKPTVGRVRRDALRRQIERGNIEARREYRITGNLNIDWKNDFGETHWYPARITESRTAYEDEGFMNMPKHMFSGKGTQAFRNASGTITLRVNGGQVSFELRERS